MDYKKIAEIISTSKKKTPAKVYIQGNFKEENFKDKGFQAFGEGRFWILIGDYPLIERWVKKNREKIKDHFVDITARYSALSLLDLRKVEARIEPGAIVREGARIGKDCIVMMGAVINIGAEVGEKTMVDMNAVVGARAIIGKNCHIGAGAVVAGVLEPPSKKPVIIENNVFIGANAVVLEGVKIGRESVVAAGAVVLEDVPPGVVVAGVPASVKRRVEDISQKEKIAIVKSLRNHG
ncbi:MAG: 2,3,4,5-tetrahydropyridine-2,6-dicarboxylate N-acetyltransferase [Candidatus Aminicenantes bacterium]|nr:2,3,4,5-tetrahydropyridine-2,6-dicarboxylate N-acetyltransferase [Candidatus Aminicenantes bacterium]